MAAMNANAMSSANGTPAKSIEPTQPLPASGRPVTAQDPLRVLIVEDSRIVSERLVSMINSLNLNIRLTTAADGPVAEQLFGSLHPDAVVLDIALPTANGFDLLVRFKSQQPACVVIMLTTYAYPEFRENAKRLGAEFFFSKNMDFERVVDVLAAMAAGRPSLDMA